MKRLGKWLLPLAVLVIFSFALSACGGKSAVNNESGKGNQAAKANASSAAPSSQEPAASGETATYKNPLGEAVIKGTPKRIVALDWTYAEDLIALGIQPAGVADIKGYKQWVNGDTPLGSDVVDVGTRQEPNLEAIAALEPDLIITADYRAESIYDKLNAIAPTLAFSPYPNDPNVDQYQEMIDTFNTIAKNYGQAV
ncbi:ABC transporter substrate-binding protein [Paenibacillus caui]|uniref:ABC transporter substrate-binding protein n=1 Tax=Paenibacillus caui TaxID=2873927 RepID=UPI001F43EC55|nr:ABC transporter substrate-binding protein [Paenibacillus caui]